MTQTTDLKQIENTLKNTGFDVWSNEESLLIGLNRPVAVSEVQTVLYDYDETFTLTRDGGKVRLQNGY